MFSTTELLFSVRVVSSLNRRLSSNVVVLLKLIDDSRSALVILVTRVQTVIAFYTLSTTQRNEDALFRPGNKFRARLNVIPRLHRGYVEMMQEVR